MDEGTEYGIIVSLPFNVEKDFLLDPECFVLLSCNVRREDSDINLQMKLMSTLRAVSPDGNIQFFILPESGDFKSIPQDSTNPITSEKVILGQQLFFDPAISFNPKCTAAAGTFSCASCHFAGAGFSSGVHQAIVGDLACCDTSIHNAILPNSMYKWSKHQALSTALFRK